MSLYHTLITCDNFDHDHFCLSLNFWKFQLFRKVWFNLTKSTLFYLISFFVSFEFTDRKQEQMLDFIHLLYAYPCTLLYIINVARIFETKGIVFRVTQLKIFIFPCCLRFEIRLDIKNWHCLFWHSMIWIKIFQIYISRTSWNSYFGESDNPIHSVFVKKVLYRCFSRILSKRFRKSALKNS